MPQKLQCARFAVVGAENRSLRAVRGWQLLHDTNYGVYLFLPAKAVRAVIPALAVGVIEDDRAQALQAAGQNTGYGMIRGMRGHLSGRPPRRLLRITS